ncbi:hypothetical protein CH272_28180 [Rhodococcus sp. 05-340-1]|uniref:hypothetical protein n=1 Tax=unclassified Rhodococcus (in: high G+C Gram-positive bacteria) TaxID=192944 RepID=UPI000B9A3CB2|nr:MULTISPECIES: hypothetical protein [unclassified Rhodococcus (in: high G+C Gram-positive bacteria)]OZC87817.1 hypothetical protein CH254_14825 [Rhodococcus sp. 06-412-2C]OZC96466.1 hypothetical protein CH279_14990 [Rhodococcus sp. 06-412-2B]OZD65260.1 hypothetical protein CH271_19615 [Rhodococcus sp. 05-340-2]OZD69294.1 hypothetical protein CH272_28180 [Rhodococcus sp. 05-340-1]
MNVQTSPTELTDLFSTAELIFGAGALALFMGFAMILTGRNSAAVAGAAAAATGIVTIAVGMTWSVVGSFDDIINIFFGGDPAPEFPVLGFVSAILLGALVFAVCGVVVLTAIAVSVSVVRRRIHGDELVTAMSGERP